ncbi:hypothetical protein HAX54_039769 [Datura stramonium]|uniref:Uncharacterized protein n=1 Tax=Datura stramonium TaxID=4076 RepID=A0ABS8SJJ1_DATST|nr:hypothetical protein [Datura stramonium]
MEIEASCCRVTFTIFGIIDFVVFFLTSNQTIPYCSQVNRLRREGGGSVRGEKVVKMALLFKPMEERGEGREDEDLEGPFDLVSNTGVLRALIGSGVMSIG